MPTAPQPRTAAPKAPPESALLRLLRGAGLVVLLGAGPLALLHPLGVRIVWAVAVAALPLGIVLAGYHAWRRVCPLAFFATLGQRLKRQGKRKAGEWLGRHHLDVQAAVLAVAMALRHLGANDAPWALALLFAAVVLAALTTGFLYTGKTWCNHFCPVGLVEKLYLEPTQLAAPGGNSQCPTCTACKKNCPDIDLEQAYWKEADLPARRRAYFLWPGLVLGYFAYPWLATGNWTAYGPAAWSPGGAAPGLLSPGFFFAPAIPRLLAVPATLAAFALASGGAFRLVERALRRAGTDAGQARHRAMALAAFAGFLLFYGFAGQAVLSLLPAGLDDVLSVGVVVAATLVLLGRWRRTETDYVHEKFARGLLKRWEWGDTPPTDNLSDLYLLHQERSQQKEARLAAYKATVRDLLAEGVLSQGNLRVLQRMRAELGIPDKDHDKLLSELDLEDRRLLDPEYQGSMEKRLQLDQYRRALESILLDGAGAAPSPAVLEALRLAHGIDEAEHETLLAELRGEASPLRARLREPMDALLGLHRTRLAADRLESEWSADAPVGPARARRLAFLRHVVRWRQREEVERILRILDRIPGGPEVGPLHRLISSTAPEALGELVAALGALAPELAALAALPTDPGDQVPALLPAAKDESAYLRAAALALLAQIQDPAAEAALRAALVDPSALVRDTAQAALGASQGLEDVAQALSEEDDEQAWLLRAAVQALPGAGRAGQGTLRHSAASLGRLATPEAPLAAIEKLMYLHGVPLFGELGPEDLEAMAASARERRWAAGDTLCRQGEWSDDVFLLLRGRVRAWVQAAEGHPRVLGDSTEGAGLGEMAALDPAPRTATLTALSEVKALVLDGAAFRNSLQARPEVAGGVLRVLTRRLRSLIREVQAEPSPGA
ncbi:MAG TPA: cyclic nucleotide-binding domain-containing protein [Holophagaceae bacterium]